MQPEIREFPDQCYCPLSGQLMKEPVILITGYTYDKQALLRFFLDHGTKDPANPKEDLNNSRMTPNRALQSLIGKFQSGEIARQHIHTQIQHMPAIEVPPLKVSAFWYGDDTVKALKENNASSLTKELEISLVKFIYKKSKHNRIQDVIILDYESVIVRLKHLDVIILDYERVIVRLKDLVVIILDYERVKVRLKHLVVIILYYERVKVKLKHLGVIILDYERVKVRLNHLEVKILDYERVKV